MENYDVVSGLTYYERGSMKLLNKPHSTTMRHNSGRSPQSWVVDWVLSADKRAGARSRQMKGGCPADIH